MEAHRLTPIIDAYKEYFGDHQPIVVWDVGSRDGDDGVWIAEQLGGGQVVCVEPNPDQVLIIRQRHPEARVLRMAVSNKKGIAAFIVYEGDEGAVGSSSLNLRWKKGDLEGHIIKVKTERLENLIGSETVDVMKIDVEGYSVQALRGLGKKLNQVKLLHIETEEWRNTDKKVKDYLSKHNWLLVDERQEWSGMPDLIFVNASLVARK